MVYPGLEPDLALGRGEKAYLVPMLAAAIAGTVVRLDAIFDFRKARRILRRPVTQRGTTDVDINRQYKLHFIREILGEEFALPEDVSDARLNSTYRRMLTAMASMRKKGNPVLATDEAFAHLDAELYMEDLMILEPSGEDMEDEFFPNLVEIFTQLKQIYNVLAP